MSYSSKFGEVLDMDVQLIEKGSQFKSIVRNLELNKVASLSQFDPHRIATEKFWKEKTIEMDKLLKEFKEVMNKKLSFEEKEEKDEKELFVVVAIRIGWILSLASVVIACFYILIFT